jgi:surface protein
MFIECIELEELDLSNNNTSKVTDMGSMFFGCVKLKRIKGIEKFNTNEVNNMNGMFSECKELEEIDLSNFNTSNVTNMRRMFFGLNKSCEIIAKDKKLFNIINN